MKEFFQKQQVLPKWKDRWHFNSQCLYCYFFWRWLSQRTLEGSFLLTNTSNTCWTETQVYLKYSLLLEEIQYEGLVLSTWLSLDLLAEVMVNEKLLPETSELENGKLQDHLLGKPYQIKCQWRTWSLSDGDTTKRWDPVSWVCEVKS